MSLPSPAAAIDDTGTCLPMAELCLLDDFLHALEHEIHLAGSPVAADGNAVAVLTVSLQRSDRIDALITPHYQQQMRASFLARIQPALRDKDRFIFVSEDECWFMLPQLASEALAILAVHRLLKELSAPLKVDSHTIFFNPYIGVACAPMHGNSAESLLRAADTAQKNASRDNHKFLIAQTSHEQRVMPQDLLAALEDVLDNNRLEMRYQPKVDLRSKSVVSVEALVRWPYDHPLKVETTLLIDTAERSGLIELLTMRVLNKVLNDMVLWRSAGMNVLVWVNLSARLLGHEELPKLLERVLSIWDIPASCIGLEITESALIHDIEHTTDLLFELKDLGFHLSIDDFGTGYSSLAYLRRFPIDELKIDRMFIHGMTESVQDKQIVQSIIGLAHNFGLPVVAEGVENLATLTALELMGCDQIQGYLFAKPMPGNELLGWCDQFHRAAQG
ncbi:hypothetical protein BH11PSE12_BH11PSE12_06350 [soil metagenome]